MLDLNQRLCNDPCGGWEGERLLPTLENPPAARWLDLIAKLLCGNTTSARLSCLIIGSCNPVCVHAAACNCYPVQLLSCVTFEHSNNPVCVHAIATNVCDCSLMQLRFHAIAEPACVVHVLFVLASACVPYAIAEPVPVILQCEC